MNSLKQNWFSEIDEDLWPDCCFSLKCDELLYDQKSKYQHVQVFKKYLF
jgi:spermidine synthase